MKERIQFICKSEIAYLITSCVLLLNKRRGMAATALQAKQYTRIEIRDIERYRSRQYYALRKSWNCMWVRIRVREQPGGVARQSRTRAEEGKAFLLTQASKSWRVLSNYSPQRILIPLELSGAFRIVGVPLESVEVPPESILHDVVEFSVDLLELIRFQQSAAMIFTVT